MSFLDPPSTPPPRFASPKPLKSPLSSPETPPQSSPSPLLLSSGGSDLTPITSRDEDALVLSDYSDTGSTDRLTQRQRHRSGRPRSTTPRRRGSDASGDSKRSSLRSSSAQREKIPLTTKIFRNLLILEESLRQQSKDQRVLRRKFTTFLAVLTGAEVGALYALYFSPTPSQGLVRLVLQFGAVLGAVTMLLFQLSGEYRRTVVIPRKFFTSTNKGLRQLNLRLVKVKAPLSDTFIDYSRSIIRYIISWILFVLEPLVQWSLITWTVGKLKLLENSAQARIGATDVKLVLNPRSFNSEIREAWEVYRDGFWAREGAKRRHHHTSALQIQITETNASVSGGKVMNKNTLMENHRKQRRERRRSKVEDQRPDSRGIL